MYRYKGYFFSYVISFWTHPQRETRKCACQFRCVCPNVTTRKPQIFIKFLIMQPTFTGTYLCFPVLVIIDRQCWPRYVTTSVRVCAQLQRNQRTVYRGDKCFEQNLQGNMKHILCRVNFLRQSSYVFKKTKKNTDFLDCVRDSKTVRMILTSFQFVLEALGPRIVCVYSVWKHGKKVRKQQRKCARIAML